MKMMKMIWMLVALALAGTTAEAQVEIVVEGLMTPESALHDPEADVYLVSNINGGPSAVDGNGFISRVAPDGTIVELKWIDGQSDGVTLNAPKGSAIHGDRFYVADIDTVRVFDRVSGESVADWPVAGAGFLNDVAVGADGTVYVTDTGIRITASGFEPASRPAVYRCDEAGAAEMIASGEELGLPNGVVEAPQGLVVVPVNSNRVLVVGEDGSLSTLAELPHGRLDGVVVARNGSLLVSSIEGSAIYRVDPEGAVAEVMTEMPAAEIGLDRSRGRLLIPQLQGGRLIIAGR